MNAVSSQQRQSRQVEVARSAPKSSAEPVTFLFSDIVGFSAMTERLGDLRAHRVVQQHHRIVRSAMSRHGGEEIELRGDGFLLAFGSPMRALRCAVAIQIELGVRTCSCPEEPLQVRMGLHRGLALRDGSTYFGKTLIVASRIADLARPSEILVSECVSEAVGSAIALPLEPVHEIPLKGLPGTWRVQGVQWGESLTQRRTRIEAHIH
jgi:class 3 adenylate cyclase